MTNDGIVTAFITIFGAIFSVALAIGWVAVIFSFTFAKLFVAIGIGSLVAIIVLLAWIVLWDKLGRSLYE